MDQGVKKIKQEYLFECLLLNLTGAETYMYKHVALTQTQHSRYSIFYFNTLIENVTFWHLIMWN